MVTFKAFFLELLILANYYWYRTQSAETVVFRIGALLSSSAVMDHFNNAANETIQLDDVRIKFVPTSDVRALQTVLLLLIYGSMSSNCVNNNLPELLSIPIHKFFFFPQCR